MRQLAEFVCVTGDLYAPREGRAVDPDEGQTRQREAQAAKLEAAPDYRTEVPLQMAFSLNGKPRTLTGRADGLQHHDDLVTIDEYKCRGALPGAVDAVDRGQAWLYAGLHAIAEPEAAQRYQVRVIYVHVDTGEERMFSEIASREEVSAALNLALLCYTVRVARHQERTRERDQWADTLAFPMPAFRPNQRAIARRVYQTLASASNLLLEAPTGSGKSLAVLYPAIRAQRDDAQIFFLTSRNAGARAALATAAQLDPACEQLVTVELTAKEKICPVEGMPCDATRCPYAAGYYDRVRAAVDDLLEARRGDRETVERIAETHQVCPFELSLDTAIWADVIVGDYNYLLDPIVRLQRFSGHESLHVLVDEAHQLSARVSEMLTVSCSRKAVREAASTMHTALSKRVASVNRALMRLRREHGEGAHELDQPSSLQRALKRLLEAVAEEEDLLERFPEIRSLYFEAWRWQRAETWSRADNFTCVLDVEGRDVTVTRLCLDPADYIAEVLASHGAVVRFSGTVTPLDLYQRMHGATGSSAERAGSPFDRSQTLVVTVPDVPTFYRQREAGLDQLATMIEGLVLGQAGRYLIALPSYQYLSQLSQKFSDKISDDVHCYQQTPGMQKDSVEQMLDEFAQNERGLLFIVSGGVIGESVDFADCKLAGVVLVGLGLPPPSLKRDLIARYYDAAQGAGWGQMVAYTQPALVKNVQAAGRLLRSPTDSGIICLVDSRFSSAEVQRFFPSHWMPQVAKAEDVPTLARNFFEDTEFNAHEHPTH